MESEQYNLKIIRMTHMTAEMFPSIDCNIHNNVMAQQQQYVGRGVDDDESASSSLDDEYEDDDDRPWNPFILDEADVDDDLTVQQSDDEDRLGGQRNQEVLIRQYVQSQCRSQVSCPCIVKEVVNVQTSFSTLWLLIAGILQKIMFFRASCSLEIAME